MSGPSANPTWIGRQFATASYLGLLAETADRAATRHLLANERLSDDGQLDRATRRVGGGGRGRIRHCRLRTDPQLTLATDFHLSGELVQ